MKHVLLAGFVLSSVLLGSSTEARAGEPGLGVAPGDCHWVTKYREVKRTVKEWYTVRGIVDYQIKRWKEPTGAYEYDCNGCLVELYRVCSKRVPVYGPIKQWRWVCKTVVVPVDRVLICKTPACFSGDCAHQHGHHQGHAPAPESGYYEEPDSGGYGNPPGIETIPRGEVRGASHRTVNNAGWRSAAPQAEQPAMVPLSRPSVPLQTANMWSSVR